MRLYVLLALISLTINTIAEEDHHAHASIKNPLEASHIKDPEHLMEHFEGVMNKKPEDMTSEELQFYYFKLHDYDNNNMLDGLELAKAMTHYHPKAQGHNAPQGMSDENLISILDPLFEERDKNEEVQHADKRPPPEPMKDDDLSSAIDEVLKTADSNNDGLISYGEYLQTVRAGGEEDKSTTKEGEHKKDEG